MELKTYQRQVIADLNRYLELLGETKDYIASLGETKDYIASFRLFWQEKGAPTLGIYQDVLPGVPNLCFKVPAAGKPFLPATLSGPCLTRCRLPRQKRWCGWCRPMRS